MWQYHSHLWLLYCKIPPSTPSLQPLTLTPFLLAAGFEHTQPSHWRPPTSELGCVAGGRERISQEAPAASFHVGPEPNGPSLRLCKLPYTVMLIEPVKALFSPHLCHLPLIAPPSLHSFTPLALAPSPHRSALSQQIAGSPKHHCSALSPSYSSLMTSFCLLCCLFAPSAITIVSLTPVKMANLSVFTSLSSLCTNRVYFLLYSCRFF